VHLLMSLYLVGIWVSIGYMILVTLGGCRHLDGLEAAEE
jgi:ABC-type sugar transport system permease subunit